MARAFPGSRTYGSSVDQPFTLADIGGSSARFLSSCDWVGKPHVEKTGLFCRKQKILPVDAVPLQVSMNSMAYWANEFDCYVLCKWYRVPRRRKTTPGGNCLSSASAAMLAPGLTPSPRPHISTRAGALRTEAHRFWAQLRAGPGSLVPASFSVPYCICIHCNNASTHSQQGLAPS